MPCFLAGFISAGLGLLIYHFGQGNRCIEQFLLTIGSSVYQLNRYGLDDEERLVKSQSYAIQITKRLFVLALAALLLIGVASAPFYFVDYDRYSTSEFIVYPILGALPPCVLFYALRKRVGSQEYPPAKQVFFYLTLGVPRVGQIISKIERLTLSHPDRPERVLIVTGLARAGTTALLNRLHRHPQLWSFTYRHMPFLLSSRLWLKFNRARSESRERSHRDGIMVGLDSPEAFDEYLWRIILQEDYYRGETLRKHAVDESQLELYEALASAHLNPGMVYLTKNNNFLLRAESVLAKRNDYLVALVYRDPLEHSRSLIRQHEIQSEAQTCSPFILDYMDMLGHHEFGRHRYDFLFEESQFQYDCREDLNYWLERWIDYYKNALRLPRENVQFISNDSIRRNSGQIEARILEGVGLQPVEQVFEQTEAALPKYSSPECELSPELLHQAKEIYKTLDSLAAVQKSSMT